MNFINPNLDTTVTYNKQASTLMNCDICCQDVDISKELLHYEKRYYTTKLDM